MQPMIHSTEGGLAGYYDYLNEQNARRSNEQGFEQQDLATLIKQKEAAVAQAQMNSPEWMEATLGGEIGRNQTSAATGQYDQAILPQKTATAQAEFAGKKTRMDMEAEANQVDGLLRQIQMNGPAGLSMAMQGLDPEDQAQFQSLIQSKGIDGAMKTLQDHSNNIRTQLAQTPEVRGRMMEQAQKQEGDMAKDAQTGAWHKDVARIAGQSRLDLERAGIEAGKYNRAKASLTIEQKLINAKNPIEKAEVLESAYFMVKEHDPSYAAELAQRAMEARLRAAEWEKNKGLGSNINKVDPTSVVSGFQKSPAPTATAPIAGQQGTAPTQTKLTPEQRAELIKKLSK